MLTPNLPTPRTHLVKLPLLKVKTQKIPAALLTPNLSNPWTDLGNLPLNLLKVEYQELLAGLLTPKKTMRLVLP